MGAGGRPSEQLRREDEQRRAIDDRRRPAARHSAARATAGERRRLTENSRAVSQKFTGLKHSPIPISVRIRDPGLVSLPDGHGRPHLGALVRRVEQRFPARHPRLRRARTQRRMTTAAPRYPC